MTMAAARAGNGAWAPRPFARSTTPMLLCTIAPKHQGVSAAS